MEKEKIHISDLQYIKGVGPKKAEVLQKEGITSINDFILNFPKSYIDRQTVQNIRQLLLKMQNENLANVNLEEFNFDITLRSEVTILAHIIEKKEVKRGKGQSFLSLRVKDSSGAYAQITFWQGVRYYINKYFEGQFIAISGKPDYDNFGVKFNHPEIEIIDEEDQEMYKNGMILPKYRISDNMSKVGITLNQMRIIAATILESKRYEVKDTLPKYLISKMNLLDLHSTIQNLHFPQNHKSLEAARYRIKFEELFYYELKLAHKKIKTEAIEKAPVFSQKSVSARKIYDALPFELSNDQKKVLREISSDFISGKPMNRLLQGDVGSGKTIVAILSMLIAIDNGYQVAIIAPTEILAEQHFHTIKKFISSLDLTVTLMVGTLKARAKREAKDNMASGKTNIVVGTHALFQESMTYNNLAFIVIDEQHRFGVSQKSDFKKLAQISLSKENHKTLSPHILNMSATPIPRTLQMTYFADLDASIIKTKPKNRIEIKTKVSFESQYDKVVEFIKSELKSGRQAYIVYPLIEVSEKLELKSAVEHFELIQNDLFKEFKCAMLHGQMFWYEKEEVMSAFLNKEYDIIVSTTVIEVGIDVPNASVMMIENAERFGLSQLHQLRGRVGRGANQSYCILMTKDNFKFKLQNGNDDTQAAVIRLKAMEETSDGFRISEIDLKLRGPGDVLGTKQSGLPEFKYADIINDVAIIEAAKKEAFEIIKEDLDLQMDKNKIILETLMKNTKLSEDFYNIA